MFSLSTNAEHMHGMLLAYSEGSGLYGRLEEKSIEVYEAAGFHASSNGMILTDIKFEFGRVNGELAQSMKR